MIGLASIAGDPLLRRLMVAGRVSDPELERVLTVARHALLDWACGTNPSGAELVDFFGALAEQCFLNEYAFAQSDDECAAVERIATQLSERASAGGYCGYIPPAWLIATAAYRPLHTLAGTEALLGRAWPAAIERLLVLQVREPLEERAIATALPALTPIEDRVSRAVQAQYEANPYPRWVMAAPAATPVAIGDDIRGKFPLAPYRPRGAAEHLDILVAGCGTGAHPIETCRRYAGARVLAVDLSRASLAYAARKTRALGLPIAYAQADILALGALDRRFDLIEASGSLQCLADPRAGWRVLLGLLAPGGLMQVGLYSKLARTDINAARAYIKGRRYDGTADDIRRFRQEALAWPDGTPGRSVTRLGDFYSTSGCRDLLFHVEEYQHDLPEIAAFIAEEGLTFLGFDLDIRVLHAYAAANPDDPAMTNLARWHRFEVANPGIFAAMYQFWVQKT
ncbi:MAG TPA: class I SAM-dependent methyltransferase [Xanthobacteraceae bacterium]